MRISNVHRAGKAALSSSKLAAEIQRRVKIQEENEILQKAAPEADKSYQMESMIASAFLRANASSFESYQRHANHVKKLNTAKKRKATEKVRIRELFPYKSENLTDVFVNKEAEEPPENLLEAQPDRGFFVKGDIYCDEYTAATTASIPDDELNEPLHLFRNTEDAVERIKFYEPHQSPKPNFSTPTGMLVDIKMAEGDWQMEYGKEDPEFKMEADISCSGCGAKLHCHDSALPGFVPVELLEKTIYRNRKNHREQINELCRRCYMLKKHDFLLNVNVSPVNYSAIMGHLKMVQEALILLVVDMTDIRGSIYQQLPTFIGQNKPMIVIGNKVDLLPPDARTGYLKNFHSVLRNEIEAAGFLEKFNVLGVSLVSAKTGYGIEDLISLVYLHWMHIKGGLRGDIYVVGCTNAGKSTLFNAFLQSDLCKIRAVDLVERVTTSIWPGTTLSLLKFPVMSPTGLRMELRRRRLLTNMAWANKETYFQQKLFESTNDPKYLTLIGKIESTFREPELEKQPLKKEHAEKIFEGQDLTDELSKKMRTKRLDSKDFVDGRWCFDTPGTVSENQILDMLTLDELIRVIPRTMIIPRTFICNAGESLLIGGLARIDVKEVFQDDEAPSSVHGLRPLTVFASKQLPAYVMRTEAVYTFLHGRLGTDILGAPIGDKDRMDMFPRLKGETFTIVTKDRFFLRSSKDILLSSIGWVLVSSQFAATFRVLTPGGRGIGLRDPLLPAAVDMKGSRIPNTAEYKTKIFLPEPEKKKKIRRRSD